MLAIIRQLWEKKLYEIAAGILRYSRCSCIQKKSFFYGRRLYYPILDRILVLLIYLIFSLKAFDTHRYKGTETLGKSSEVQKVINGYLINPDRKLSEEEVLFGLRNGDESVLGYVYSQYVKRLFRFGLQYSTDEDLIMDSIHDVFVNLIHSKKTLAKIKSVKAYLFASLYRRIVYYLNRRKYLDIKVSESRQFPVAFNPESNMFLDEENKEKLQRVRQAISQLSKKQRQAVLHYYSDGFNHQEIAQIMGMRNTNSVAKLIARGLSAVRALVEKGAISVMWLLMVAKVFL